MGERSASLTCDLLNSARSRVARSIAKRWVATSRSRGFRNQAVVVSLGISKMNSRPVAEVRPPQIKNRQRHAARDILLRAIPYIMRAPIIWDIPLIDTHVATRIGCSWRLYQILVIIMKAGETVPGNQVRALTQRR